MTSSFPKWLTKRMIKGVSGFNLDSYLVALEGWRRGLTLTWYYDPSEVTDMKIIGFNPLGKTFSLESNEQQTTHYFYRSRGDKVSNEAVEIVHQKHQAKTYLNKEGVPTPKGIMIDKGTDKKEILNNINVLNYPLVVKPVLGSLGKGVTTEIQNEEDLFAAIKSIENNYEDYDQFIIEEYVNGEEYRVYVVNDQVAAVTKRIPANVIGDGQSTIKELIETKNHEKKENPYLSKKPIKLDDTIINYLHRQDMSIEDVPAKDQHVRLKGQSNISAGGDPIDATDELNEFSKNVAISAIKAIPGLIHAGVDIIVNDESTTVLEVNATADISMHIFPMAGESQNVPAEIINYYFPNKEANSINKSRLYFDYMDVRGILRRKLAQEIRLTNVPNGKFHTTRYIISGKVQKVGFRNWIRKEAIRRGLHGYTRNLKNKKVVVVVGGNKKTVENFKDVCAKGPSKAKVKNVSELEWESPIKLGFEIRKSE